MRKVKHIAAASLFMYLIGAFGAASFDLSQWDEQWRLTVCIVIMVAALIAVMEIE